MRAIPTAPLGRILNRAHEPVDINPEETYKQVTVRLFHKGVVLRGLQQGGAISSRQWRIRSGQVLLSRIDARNGAIGLVPVELDSAIVTNDFWPFDVNTELAEPKYLDLYFGTRQFVEDCQRASEGTTNRVRVQPDRFLRIEVPLPSLSGQRRIVARIEELSAKIEEAHVMHRQVVEETETLLYVALRQTRQQLSKSSHSKFRLGSLTKVSSGGTPSRNNPAFWNGDIPWIKTGELLDGDISRAEEHITQEGLENSSAKLFPSQTILVALYGQGQTRGRTGRLLIPATTNQACCAVLPNQGVFEPGFIQFWLRSLYVELREEAQGGAQPNWNGAMIKDLVIILPSGTEQRRIVAYLDELQSKVDTVKKLQEESEKELNAIMPSILCRAFAGEL